MVIPCNHLTPCTTSVPLLSIFGHLEKYLPQNSAMPLRVFYLTSGNLAGAVGIEETLSSREYHKEFSPTSFSATWKHYHVSVFMDSLKGVGQSLCVYGK